MRRPTTRCVGLITCQARSQSTLHKKGLGKGQSSYRLAAPLAATSMTCVAYQLDAKSAQQQSWPAIESHNVNQECPEHPTALESVPIPVFLLSNESAIKSHLCESRVLATSGCCTAIKSHCVNQECHHLWFSESGHPV